VHFGRGSRRTDHMRNLRSGPEFLGRLPPVAQFRLRLYAAGDGDGEQDLVAFFKSDSNTNEPGIFLLDVTVSPNAKGSIPGL